MRMSKSAIALSILASLAACGGGGGGSPSPSTGSLTGAFIDAPVQGLYYETTTGVSGLTDAEGKFKFNAGDAVTFKIGGAQGLELASTTPTASDNTQIKATELEGGAQIAQVLQTFNTSITPDTKLDLSKITFTEAQKTIIREHIVKQADLGAFVTAAAAIVSDVSSKVGVTLAVKTKQEVEDHLARAETNFPTTTLPAIDNKNFFVIDNQTNMPSILGVKSGKAELLSEYFDYGIGTFKVSNSTKGELRFTSVTAPGSTTEEAVNCKIDLTFKGKLPLKEGIDGFIVDTQEEASCNDGVARTAELTFVPMDLSFGISNLSGKTLLMTGLEQDGSACGDISLKFGEGTSELSVAATYDSNSICKDGFKFSADTKLSLLTSKASNIMTIKVDYGYGYKGQFIIAKTLGVTPKLGVIFAANFDPNAGTPTEENSSEAKWKMRSAQPTGYSIK